MNRAFPPRSFVNAMPCIDARTLRRIGLFDQDEPRSVTTAVDWSSAGEEEEARFRASWDPEQKRVELALLTDETQRWSLDVVYESRIVSGRYYFLCPETGERCEKLYFAEGGWAGRKARRLVYPSQYGPRASLYSSRLRKLNQRFADAEQGSAEAYRRRGGPEMRPQPPRRSEPTDFGDLVEILSEDVAEERPTPAREAALGTEMALERAQALTLETDDSLEWLFRRCDAFKDAVKTAKRKRPPNALATAAVESVWDYPRISLQALADSGRVREGSRSGARLDWSGAGAGLERCDLVLDLRGDPAFAGIELVDGQGVSYQVLRLERSETGLAFVCPFSGAKTETIAYRDGWFGAPAALKLQRA